MAGTCSACGNLVAEPRAARCGRCGAELVMEAMLIDESPSASPRPMHGSGYGPSQDLGQDAGMRLLLPVGRSLWAIAAGYLGLLSPLCIFAPFALVTGIVAILDIKKHPDRHGMGRAIFGIVMGAIFSLALVIMLFALVGEIGRGR